MIVGTGNVGASIAFAFLNQRTPVSEIILSDINADDAAGEVMDLSDALAVSPSFVRLRQGDYSEAADCDICVITAGASQKPGETRIDLLQKNAAILRSIVAPIMESGFNGIFLIVSNPVDTLSMLTCEYSGLPPERVIGSGTVLDSARLRFYLAKELDVHPKSVHAYQVGEHGDSEFTLWSSANLGGEKITSCLPKYRRDEIEKSVRDQAYEIIKLKGATHYGIAGCVVQIVSCILNDEHRVLPVSNYDDNNGVYNGYPAIIGRRGIIRRLDNTMTEAENIKFQCSVNILRKTLDEAHSA